MSVVIFYGLFNCYNLTIKVFITLVSLTKAGVVDMVTSRSVKVVFYRIFGSNDFLVMNVKYLQSYGYCLPAYDMRKGKILPYMLKWAVFGIFC